MQTSLLLLRGGVGLEGRGLAFGVFERPLAVQIVPQQPAVRLRESVIDRVPVCTPALVPLERGLLLYPFPLQVRLAYLAVVEVSAQSLACRQARRFFRITEGVEGALARFELILRRRGAFVALNDRLRNLLRLRQPFLHHVGVGGLDEVDALADVIIDVLREV